MGRLIPETTSSATHPSLGEHFSEIDALQVLAEQKIPGAFNRSLSRHRTAVAPRTVRPFSTCIMKLLPPAFTVSRPSLPEQCMTPRAIEHPSTHPDAAHAASVRYASWDRRFGNSIVIIASPEPLPLAASDLCTFVKLPI